MFSITRAGHHCVPALAFSLLIPACTTSIPETFAQTPSAAAVAMVSYRADSTGGDPEQWPAQATEIEKRAFELTNAAREGYGLMPLAWDPELCVMARMHSESMGRLGFFSHETPEGLRMTDRARALGISHFRMLGENIAYNQGFEDPGGFAVEEWLLSPGHRANILRTEFRQSAIGVFIATDGTVYLTQEFITR
jgi:uncharacterized protein YkwD